MLQTGWTFDYVSTLTYPQIMAMIETWMRQREEELKTSQALLGKGKRR